MVQVRLHRKQERRDEELVHTWKWDMAHKDMSQPCHDSQLPERYVCMAVDSVACAVNAPPFSFARALSRSCVCARVSIFFT